jgi:hypothetical protein
MTRCGVVQTALLGEYRLVAVFSSNIIDGVSVCVFNELVWMGGGLRKYLSTLRSAR